MKKITTLIVLAVLCLNFSGKAQPKAVNTLKIGDDVPDLTLNNVLNHSTKTIRLSDYAGKLLILDFWATWCAPCVAMIPDMNKLQDKYTGKMQFLPVAYESPEVIEKFMTKLKDVRKIETRLPVVTGDKVLVKLFPHTYLPHFVWIDGKGKVVAITEEKDITASNIEKYLTGKTLALQEKHDAQPINYDGKVPFFKPAIPQAIELTQYSSTLSGNIEGVAGIYHRTEGDSLNGRRLTMMNFPLISLYQMAYCTDTSYLGKNQVILQSKDADRMDSQLSGAAYGDWKKQGNAFCYELRVPFGESRRLYDYAREDLKRYFPQYRAVVKDTAVICLALVRTSKADKIASRQPLHFEMSGMQWKMHHYDLQRLVTYLSFYYMQGSKLPIVDGTGYKGKADVELEANMSNVESVNKALAAYDLQLVEKKMTVPMLIISDNPKPTK